LPADAGAFQVVAMFSPLGLAVDNHGAGTWFTAGLVLSSGTPPRNGFLPNPGELGLVRHQTEAIP
jgi:hypothetical protein